MKLARYLTMFALPLIFSLAFASPALADDEFCIVLDKTVLENIDPALLGESAQITVVGVPDIGDPQSQVINATNTAACFTITMAVRWVIQVNNKRGDKFVLGVSDPAFGKLEVFHLKTEDFWDKEFNGDFGVRIGFAGVQFGNLSVASVQTGDDGVYRVIMTGSLIEEVLEINKATRQP